MTHEPVALPGGYILIPAASFREAQDEAEFAGMLAQAMERSILSDGLRRTNQSPSPETIPLLGRAAEHQGAHRRYPIQDKSAAAIELHSG